MARKVERTDAGGCPVGAESDGVRRISGHAAARAVLRSTDTVQAGLGIETMQKMPSSIRRPVLYRDGPEHREHRRQTARFFTPRRVDEQYRELMGDITEAQLAVLRRDGRAHLADLGFELSIGVTAAVIGMTESRPGIRGRLERFFPEEFDAPGFTSLTGLTWVWRQARNWSAIYFRDVRPAVRERRRERRDDLISHLLDEGCSAAEVLGECITFAAAGMVTTREFINLAAWHLLSDAELRERYLAAPEADRLGLLHEILRLEPVIGRLRRRTTAAVDLPGNDVIPPGATVELVIDDANADRAEVGDEPLELRPGREIPSGAAGLAFGDGPHKCPGAHLAILETDVFLHRLLALPVRMESPPQVSFNDAISGYELRGLVVALDS
ncbi:cytochrome P450 [Saccharopolyspora sp. NFXS83]|uniref:cytochrome P450 n=1 Tax=Saccharopolyspora sp. NFXS83 TaxID=2993560 RepID=UPI00224A4A84|nr:cytochrome P450 [Saccharopolyspora sp. NFXS83]MCX2729102.1 cytochrome P450 [Saccharopolyspora sp. NFXS83]